ncbi:bifunctional phosphoribosyl-AMP cyclohydrolase/phosphoribosyl-ATP diphosphatase HisIE [Camelliibacillus cellulosilyticus]|uniref:Histidine biosynthesis bifunctional protein HisIE n=1 Tax=Camelliibacillus cellulosilyticus TaxID=2174486 RepID=A0ABV9GK69_9BACL
MTQVPIRYDEKGLVPAIVQDVQTKEVLMLAYMNEAALKQTVTSGETVFYSRSREALWHKGETSGHTQKVIDILYDCDQDALVIMVEPQGPACHTGAYSCFSQSLLSDKLIQINENRYDILNELQALIANREKERPSGAYTTYLFDKGIDKILKKVGEEATEVVIAAKNRSHDELKWEAADLIYHLLVLLQEQKLPFDDVLDVLRDRHQSK